MTTVMPIARGGSDGLASHFDPCVSSDTLKTIANKSEKPRNPSLFHAKSNTHIVCWNVCSVGSLSDQSEIEAPFCFVDNEREEHRTHGLI